MNKAFRYRPLVPPTLSVGSEYFSPLQKISKSPEIGATQTYHSARKIFAERSTSPLLIRTLFYVNIFSLEVCIGRTVLTTLAQFLSACILQVRISPVVVQDIIAKRHIRKVCWVRRRIDGTGSKKTQDESCWNYFYYHRLPHFLLSF